MASKYGELRQDRRFDSLFLLRRPTEYMCVEDVSGFSMFTQNDVPNLVRLACDPALSTLGVPFYALHHLRKLDASQHTADLIKRALRYQVADGVNENDYYFLGVLLPTLIDVLTRCGPAAVAPLLEELRYIRAAGHKRVTIVFPQMLALKEILSEFITQATIENHDCNLVKDIYRELTTHMKFYFEPTHGQVDHEAMFPMVEVLTDLYRFKPCNDILALIRRSFEVCRRADVRIGYQFVASWIGYLYDLGIEAHPLDPLVKASEEEDRRAVLKMWKARRRNQCDPTPTVYPGQPGYVLEPYFAPLRCAYAFCRTEGVDLAACIRVGSKARYKHAPEALRVCGRCMSVRYCSVYCQECDYAAHKTGCDKVAGYRRAAQLHPKDWSTVPK